jgi:hypothetical protein
MSDYPVAVQVLPATGNRNRLTTAFRFLLGLPHLILVGGPFAAGIGISMSSDHGIGVGTGMGLLGFFVCMTTIVMWLVIVLTAAHVDALWRFAAWYLRWRVRAMTYLMLLRDEYPPFGDDDYPTELQLGTPPERRSRVRVFFRLLFALPHLVLLVFIGLLWSFTTAVAWVLILFTGRYPETLYGFGLGALAWTTRVEAYLLLLRDEYPPFSLRV